MQALGRRARVAARVLPHDLASVPVRSPLLPNLASDANHQTIGTIDLRPSQMRRYRSMLSKVDGSRLTARANQSRDDQREDSDIQPGSTAHQEGEDQRRKGS